MIRTSLILTALMTLLFGIIYPLFTTTLGHLLLPKEAKGSLIRIQNTIIGASPIGQSFASDRYFNSRPSATNYDAANSAGSNLGPTSQKLHDQIATRTAAYRQQNGLTPTDPVPADAVQASASGLDPHISLKNALLQAPRVAKARNLELDTVHQRIKIHTEGGILREKYVHVLKLNLSLDDS